MRFSKHFVACIFIFLSIARITLLAQQKNPSKPPAKKTSIAAAAPKPATPLDEVINIMFAARRFEQTAISPDGKKIAWVETLIGKDGAPDGNTAIFVADADATAPPKRLSASNPNAPRAEGSVAWSRDSKQIAFLSDAAKPGQLQLYVKDLTNSGSIHRLTNVKGLLASPLVPRRQNASPSSSPKTSRRRPDGGSAAPRHR